MKRPASKLGGRVGDTRNVLMAIGLAAIVGSGAGLPAAAQETRIATSNLLPAPIEPVPPLLNAADVDRALQALDGIVLSAKEATGVPGIAVGVIYRGATVYLKGFGLREAGTVELVDEDTVFLLASVSKPIASTVIAKLVGSKVLDWHEPIVRHLPGFSLSDPYVSQHATFADMLSHRSGLSTGAGDLLEDLGFDRGTIVSRLHMQPLSDFRSTYNYSNFGYTVAGEAAAKASGIPWEDLADEVLFKPLGMSSSSYRHADYLSRPNRAHLHVRVGDPGEKNWQAKFDRNPDAEAPAGGASASIRDLTQYLRLQLNEGRLEGAPLIDADALAATHVPQQISGSPSFQAARGHFYGFGWNVSYDDEGRARIGHSGAFDLGAATMIALIPGEELGIAVVTNAQPIGVAEAIGLTFFDIAQNGVSTVDWQSYIGGVFEAMKEAEQGDPVSGTPPANARPPRNQADYTGLYQNPYYGPLDVRTEAGGLVMRLGPAEAPTDFALTHIDGDDFVFDTIGENALGLSEATFAIGADGRASSVNLGFYDRMGLGTFRR